MLQSFNFNLGQIKSKKFKAIKNLKLEHKIFEKKIDLLIDYINLQKTE